MLQDLDKKMTSSGSGKDMPVKPQGLRGMPAGIWVLGLVSLLMDISSEMIHSLLPLFMVTVLATSATTVGIIEGLAEATALIVKVFSGVLSDWLGRRKGLAVIGYGLGALTKPLFAVAGSSGLVLTARLLDRVGKGIRGAPRDALVADLTPPEIRGAAFGLRQSLDTVGAFLGPLLAVGLMLLWANDFRAVFWVAVIPGALAVLVLLLAADLVLASSAHWAVVLAGVALWGVHLGMTQGLLAALVADTVPADLRGTGYGFFNLVSGIAMLVASVLAGMLWDSWGAAYTFYAGALFSVLALGLLWLHGRRMR